MIPSRCVDDEESEIRIQRGSAPHYEYLLRRLRAWSEFLHGLIIVIIRRFVLQETDRSVEISGGANGVYLA